MRRISLLLALLLLTQVAPTRNSPCARSDTGNVAQLVASFMAGLPSSQRIPRGAFVLVCGEHIAYAAGFGRTARGAPVDPDRTLFRAASNSKLFAATAAMQLTAASKWKLTDAVNDHLPDGTKLRDGYGRQVTIADLLTHTAGFEDKFEGGLGLATDSISLAAYFARHVPLRVRAAGQELSYSNAGMALAGYAVEVASNESFAGYAERNILAPLGMTHSSFAQPVPAAWEADLATAQPKAPAALEAELRREPREGWSSCRILPLRSSPRPRTWGASSPPTRE